MKKIYLLLGLFILVINNEAKGDWPHFSFTRMGVDANKNFILFSFFQNSLSFHDTTVTGSYWPHQIIVKCDSQMNLIWFKDINSGWLSERVSEVEFACDRENNTYLACLVKSALHVQDTFYINTPLSSDSVKVGLIKYDPSGNLIWYKESTTLGPVSKKVGVGLDSSGNVYLSCNYSPRVSLGDDTLSELMMYCGTFVVKFDSSGTEQWISGFSGPKLNYDYCVSRSGSMHIAGAAWGLQVCGSDTFTTPPGSVPSVAVSGFSGIPMWHKTFVGTGNITHTVGVGPNELPVVAGQFYDTIGFNSLPSFASSDSASFIACYNADGSEKWAKRAEGVKFTELGVTNDNSIFLLGSTYGASANIDTSPIPVITGERTVIKLDSNGRFICNINLVNYYPEAAVVGPGDGFFLCGRTDIGGPSYWQRPVIGDDTVAISSDACIYIAEIGPSCELVKVRKIDNSYAALEMVPETAKSASIIFYPNPATNKISLHFKNSLFIGGSVYIRNEQGRTVQSLAANSNDVDLDVSALAPGLYTLECINGTERVVEKFIKR